MQCGEGCVHCDFAPVLALWLPLLSGYMGTSQQGGATRTLLSQEGGQRPHPMPPLALEGQRPPSVDKTLIVVIPGE